MLALITSYNYAFALDSPVLTVSTSGLDVACSWTSVPGTTNYTFYYAPYPYTASDSIGSFDMGTNTSFSITLWDGASFYVTVTADDGTVFGESGYSNIELFTLEEQVPVPLSPSLEGTWIVKENQLQYYTTYLIFDGSDIVNECGAFYYSVPAGNYQIYEDSTFSMTITSTYDGEQILDGMITSEAEAIFYEAGAAIATMAKVDTDTPSACQGIWSGSLFESNSSNTHNVTFSVNIDGKVTSYNGFSQPVTGKVFCQSDNIVAFFNTGEQNAYNQIQFGGTYLGDTMSGDYMIDNGSANDPYGTFSLVRQ